MRTDERAGGRVVKGWLAEGTQTWLLMLVS